MQPIHEDDGWCDQCQSEDPNGIYYSVMVWAGCGPSSYYGPTPPEYDSFCSACYKKYEEDEQEWQEKLERQLSSSWPING